MRHIASTLLLLAACSSPGVDPSFQVQPVAADKVQLCHVDRDSEGWFPLSVGLAAVDAHLDRHGDWLVTDEVAGDGVDNDCNGIVDDSSCPCFEDFATLFATRAGSSAEGWELYESWAYDFYSWHDYDSPDNTLWPDRTGSSESGDSYVYDYGRTASYSAWQLAYAEVIFGDHDYTMVHDGEIIEVVDRYATCSWGFEDWDGTTWQAESTDLELSIEEARACREQLLVLGSAYDWTESVVFYP